MATTTDERALTKATRALLRDALRRYERAPRLLPDSPWFARRWSVSVLSPAHVQLVAMALAALVWIFSVVSVMTYNHRHGSVLGWRGMFLLGVGPCAVAPVLILSTGRLMAEALHLRSLGEPLLALRPPQDYWQRLVAVLREPEAQRWRDNQTRDLGSSTLPAFRPVPCLDDLTLSHDTLSAVLDLYRDKPVWQAMQHKEQETVALTLAALVLDVAMTGQDTPEVAAKRRETRREELQPLLAPV